MFEWVSTLDGWASLASLTGMEIILSVDNILFLSVLVSRLPKEIARRALFIGLLMALAFRVALLLGINVVIGLETPIGVLFGHEWSWRDVILFIGGAFLIAKAVHELHVQIEGLENPMEEPFRARRFGSAILQIAIVNLVFSVDSIFTAIGMASHLSIMLIAVLISMVVMFVASGPVADFIDHHPTTKTLALAFLMLIGFSLCAEATGAHIPRGYLYAAIAFAVVMEAARLIHRKGRKKPRKAHRPPELAKKN
jgi:predicted tellurium resistance membrane protein TerC